MRISRSTQTFTRIQEDSRVLRAKWVFTISLGELGRSSFLFELEGWMEMRAGCWMVHDGWMKSADGMQGTMREDGLLEVDSWIRTASLDDRSSSRNCDGRSVCYNTLFRPLQSPAPALLMILFNLESSFTSLRRSLLDICFGSSFDTSKGNVLTELLSQQG